MAFLLEEDVIKEHEKTLFNIFEEIQNAKKYLQHHSISSGCSIYDHLAELIQKILISKPDNIVETFEIFSKQVKDERFISDADTLQDEYILSECLENIKQQLKLYHEQVNVLQNSEDSEEVANEANIIEVPNVMETNFHFRQAGFGLTEEEAFHVMVALRKLVNEHPIEKVRFFGKIFGTKQNYYIAETDVNSQEKERRTKEFLEKCTSDDEKLENVTKEIKQNNKESEKQMYLNNNENEEFAEDGNSLDSNRFPTLPPIPKSLWKAPPSIPQEKPGEGCNQKVYWVCNKLGDSWDRLPDVTPHHIDISRKITTYMTGHLDKVMITYPPFDGTEREYLRAQIARLVAGTSVSPILYYIRSIEGDDENDEEDIEIDEEDDNTAVIIKNKNYKGHAIANLADKSLLFWVHYSEHILNQGRSTWWNPKEIDEIREADDDSESTDDKSEASFKSEWGPKLLTPLSEDKLIGGVPAWTVTTYYKSVPMATFAFLRSRRWPGAAAYATKDGKCDHMYIGWGVKYNPDGFSPMPLASTCEEYPLGPEIMEIADPTTADEEQYRISHLPPKISDIQTNLADIQDQSEDYDEDEEEDDENDDDIQ